MRLLQLLIIVVLLIPFSQVSAEISLDKFPSECRGVNDSTISHFQVGGRYAEVSLPFITYIISNGSCRLILFGGDSNFPFITVEDALARCNTYADNNFPNMTLPPCVFMGLDDTVDYYNVTLQMAQIQFTTGTALSVTPTDAEVLTTSGTISDIGAILTLDNSSAIIERADGSILDINQKSVITLNPDSISVVRGEVISTMNCNYEVRTALATITLCTTNKKGADTTKFMTSYSQVGLDSTLTVSVETGSVDITDRSGVTHTVTAGNEKTITSRVTRTQWVLPIDKDKLYGGRSNYLIWTQFPDAASYQMEFNLPNPVFAENNVSVPQFTKQVVPLPAGSYAEFEGLALLTLPLPKGADGLILELRIFALDASGNIIGESVSSDSSLITIKD